MSTKMTYIPLPWVLFGALFLMSCDQDAPADRETWTNIYHNIERPSIYPDYRLSLTATPTPDGRFILNQFADNTLANDRLKDRSSALLNIDAAGDISWNKKYDLNIQGELIPIQQDGNSYYLCMGQDVTKKYCLMKVDSNGDVIWEKAYGEEGAHILLGISVNETADAIFVSGSINDNEHPASSGAFYAKLDLDGNLLWKKNVPSPPEANCSFELYHTPSSDNGLFFFNNTQPNFIGKIDSDGHVSWNRSFMLAQLDPDASEQIISSVAKTSDGGCVVMGSSLHAYTGDEYFWIMQLDASGDQEWATRLQIPVGYYPFKIIDTQDGGYAILGCYSHQSFVNLIATFFITVDQAAFLMKIDDQGQIEWAKSYRDESAMRSLKPVNPDEGPLPAILTITSLEAFSFSEATEGGYVITGHFNYQKNYPVPEEGTEYEHFVARTDTKGNIAHTDLIVRDMNGNNGSIQIEATDVTLLTNDGASALTDIESFASEAEFSVIRF